MINGRSTGSEGAPSPRQNGPTRSHIRCLWLAGGVLGLGVLAGAWLGPGCDWLAASGDMRKVDPRFLGSPPLGPPSTVVRGGQKWSFKRSPMHGGPEGVETWDVMAVDSHGVTAVVSGALPRRWTFEHLARPGGPISLVGTETVGVRDGPAILCDVVEYTDFAGERVRSWIAVAKPGGLLQFPGVVRLVRFESRGRSSVEWDLESIEEMR